MLKGCQKRIIMINDTGSDIFDQAYFIIKDANICDRFCKTDMIREANRIIDNNLLGAYFSGERKKKRGRYDVRSFVLGALFGAALVAILWLVIAGT